MSAPARLLILLAALAFSGAFAARADVPAFDLGGLDTRSAALMLSAQEAGDLAVSALAIPLPDPAGGRQSRMTVVVEIDGGSLLEAVPAGDGELITEVYAYAVDSEGGLIASLTQAFRLDLERLRPRLAGGGVKFFGTLELPPGDYSLRVLVLQRSSGRLGLRILTATAPIWGSEPVLAPVRREPAAGWILVRAAGETPAFPVTVAGEPWVPSARIRLDSGERAGYLLLGRGLGRRPRLHLLAAGGEELAELGLGDLRPVAGGPPGLEILAAELDAADLYAGEYRLRVSTTAGTAQAPLTVRSAGGPQPPAAAESRGLTVRQSRGREAELERLEQLREAYQRTFDGLASDERGTALAPLTAVHRERIGSRSVTEQKRLARAELEVAWELAGSDPERLLVVIHIHEELYRRYHRQRRYLLATHSRKLIGALAELYSERSRSSQASHLVASALVSLAGYLHQIGSRPAANDAYLQALDYDPVHPAALIGLASIQEFYGLYDRAVVLLGRLVKQTPADTQARLRLGVNLKRQGKPKRAIDHLEAAATEPGPEWVAAVAAQELASLHADNDRLEEAITVLEAAATAHPDHQRLTLQWAALLDRAGRHADALGVLDRLDPVAGIDASSPRLIYTQPPAAAITAARRALAEVTDRQLAARRVTGRPAELSAVPGGA